MDQPAAEVQQLTQTLSSDERSRAERFHFERDRRHFIVGRGLLRTILGRYLGLRSSQLQFCYGPRGKPALAETVSESKAKLYFNLAHAAGLALYAVTNDREIGVDLEQIHPIADMDQIAERFFSAQESAALRALPPEQRQEAFFNCWTRKEAYLKASGEGLAQPLDQFSVSLGPGEPAKLVSIAGDFQEASRWFIQAFSPANGYVAAVAVQGQDWRLKYWDFDGDNV